MFIALQISMSVLRIPVHVMKMLIVPTVTVLTAVLVNKDSPEMVQSAQVRYSTDLLDYLEVDWRW